MIFFFTAIASAGVFWGGEGGNSPHEFFFGHFGEFFGGGRRREFPSAAIFNNLDTLHNLNAWNRQTNNNFVTLDTLLCFTMNIKQKYPWFMISFIRLFYCYSWILDTLFITWQLSFLTMNNCGVYMYEEKEGKLRIFFRSQTQGTLLLFRSFSCLFYTL